jgi:PKD repeat protein
VESPCDVAATRDANIPTAGQALKWIKIRWTVVQNGGPNTNVSQSELDLLMLELRNDFQAFGIDFCADPAQFVSNATFYNLDVNSEDFALKNTYGANYTQVLNVYVVNTISLSATGGAGGYARFPYDPFGGTNVRGGIVLARSNASPGTHTLSHEMGHVFGLHHTFRGVDEVATCTNCYERVTNVNGSAANGDTEGDWCSDTNPHTVNTYNCFDPPGPANVCDAFTWNNTPIDNHMSYSFCTTTFSPQQSGRMHCMIDRYLSSWTSFGAVTCGAQPPVASFTGSPTRYQAPSTVTFTDLSQPATLITSWEWDFDLANLGGVTPATATGQTPPTVTYANPGLYTVRLIVRNANGSDTLIRTDYIEVIARAADCDTLFTKFGTPFPTLSAYQWAANDYLTGVPNALGEYGYYERYITPNPGQTTVGAIFVGLASFLDPDSSMRLDFVVYDDDGTGKPLLAGGPKGGLTDVEPGRMLGVPQPPFYTQTWIPFLIPAVIDSARFHVGVEIRNNDPTDRIQVLSSQIGQGQLNGDNHLVANRANPTISNYLNDISGGGFVIDFDLELIPMLGEWPALPIVNFIDSAICDTSFVLILDTLLYSSTLTNVVFDFGALGTVSGDSAADVASILLRLLQQGPLTFEIRSVNECGRADTTEITLNYRFNESPLADFSMDRPNPVCKDSVITFTALPPPGLEIQNYRWDFGDGSTLLTTSNTPTHSYSSPGLYYVSMTVTDTASCTDTEQKLGFVEVVDCAVIPPATAFSINPGTGCDFDTFAFSDNTPALPDPATSWLWDFGDGTFSNLQNPSHTYGVGGTFVVRLLASNDGGTVADSFTLVVNSCPQSLDLQLEARAVGQQVNLRWDQAVEAPGRYYRVQRSIDGQSFETIKTLSSQGAMLYSEWDMNPPSGNMLWYRLTALESNGTMVRSNTVAVNLEGSPSLSVQLDSNPVNKADGIGLSAFLPSRGFAISILDVTGKSVYVHNDGEAEGNVRLRIPLEGLQNGLYFIQVQTRNGMQKSLKFLLAD